jgi:hypothetical protein
MKTLLAIATGLLVSTTAFAGSIETIHRDTQMVTDNFSTKQEALNAGFAMYENLEMASNRQLRRQLPTFADSVTGNISIDSAQVKVEEFAVSRNQTQFRAVVDVGYSYKARDSDNN